MPMRCLHLAVKRLIALRLLYHRVDLRERNVVLRRPAQGFLALGADEKRRGRVLHERRGEGRGLFGPPLLTLMGKNFFSPHPPGDIPPPPQPPPPPPLLFPPPPPTPPPPP